MRIGLVMAAALTLMSCAGERRAVPRSATASLSGALPPAGVSDEDEGEPEPVVQSGYAAAGGAGAPPPGLTASAVGTAGGGAARAPRTATASSATVYCDLTDDEQTVRDCAAYARARRALADGVAEFKVPPAMRVGDPASIVRLAVAFDRASGFPARDVAALPGRSQRLTLKVGRFMVAELKGANFAIDPAGPVRKDLIAADTATWTWQVKALDPAGKRPLTLTTWVEVTLPGGKTAPRDVVNTDHQVSVDVSDASRFQAAIKPLEDGGNSIVDLLKIAAAIVAGLAALITAVRKLRPAADTKPPPA